MWTGPRWGSFRFLSSPTGCFSVNRGIFHRNRASGGPLFPAAGKVGKRAGRNQRFLHFLPRYGLWKLDAACRTFAQIFLFRSVKGLSQQQRRCRWLVLRTTLSVLPSQRMSGSGAGGTSVRHTARQRPGRVNAWYMVSKSERYSALRKCKNVVFAGVLSPLSFAIERKGAVGDKKEKYTRCKEAQKFWAPQQRLAAMGKSRSRSQARNSSHPRRPFSKIPVAFSAVL